MHIHSLKRAALAACVLAVFAAAPAHADPVVTGLRVEAGGSDIGPGWRYLHDSVSYTTSESEACGGTGASGTIDGPTALGLLIQAADYTAPLAPVQISDKFEFGPFVCGIGAYTSSDTAFWLYKVDHVAPEVGGDQFAIERSHDEVLWYFVNTLTGGNTGNELVLLADDAAVEAGQETEIRVLEYDAAGSSTPAAGVRIMGAGEAVTDANGLATVTFDEPGRPVVRGVRGNDIPTDGQRLCVWSDAASECDRFPVARVVGTARSDMLRGGADRELLLGRGGNDTIRSRGDGAADTVRCGRGRDTVRADEIDRVARDCERVSKK